MKSGIYERVRFKRVWDLHEIQIYREWDLKEIENSELGENEI